jgi:hypothetical protein
MDFFEFQAITHPRHFIRHRNFLGELTVKDELAEDFQFALVSRGQRGHVALRSKNFPTLFLRHVNFRIRLEGPRDQHDQLFLNDSTFLLVHGLADPTDSNLVSFNSLNFPDRFLRHRDFSLFVEPQDSPNLVRDATFTRQGPSIAFDNPQ